MRKGRPDPARTVKYFFLARIKDRIEKITLNLGLVEEMKGGARCDSMTSLGPEVLEEMKGSSRCDSMTSLGPEVLKHENTRRHASASSQKYSYKRIKKNQKKTRLAG